MASLKLHVQVCTVVIVFCFEPAKWGIVEMPVSSPYTVKNIALYQIDLGSGEPPYGVLGSRENRGQNNPGAGSRVGKSQGSREQRK